LVIEGKFDPATPPHYGQLVAGHLSHSTYVEFPNMGHVPTATDGSGCAMKIVLSFLDHLDTGPDITCLSKVPPITFLRP
jgi:pimeloyl-ACP methyl ester carboxylesterase